MADSIEEGFRKVAERGALSSNGARIHAVVNERYVTVIRHKDELFCMDSTCYHTGGPLGIGEIEDVNGETCIRCPWHSYQVTLSSGAKMYQGMDMIGGKLQPSGWKKKENAQRVHEVERRADGIYVKLSLSGKWDSDYYCKSATAGIRAQESRSSLDNKIHSKAPGLPKRSGHVLNPNFASSSSASHKPLPHDSAVFAEADEDSSRWEAMKVTKVEKDGNAGVKLWLDAHEQTSAANLVSHLLKVDEDFDDGTLNTIEDILSTRHLRVGLVVGEFVERPFTPVHSLKRTMERVASSSGPMFELRVRVYDNGTLGPALEKLKPGDKMHVAPGSSENELNLESVKLIPLCTLDQIVLFSGGSGITPILQIVQNIVDWNQPTKKLQVTIVCANKSFSRGIGLDVLEDIIPKTGESLLEIGVVHLLSQNEQTKPQLGGQVLYGVGASDIGFLKDIGAGAIDSKALYVMCGPAPFMTKIKSVLVKEFQRNADTILEYVG